jgi:hypothetical protein
MSKQKFYRIETWMNDKQAAEVMSLIESTDVIGIAVENEDSTVITEDATVAEVRAILSDLEAATAE